MKDTSKLLKSLNVDYRPHLAHFVISCLAVLPRHCSVHEALFERPMYIRHPGWYQFRATLTILGAPTRYISPSLPLFSPPYHSHAIGSANHISTRNLSPAQFDPP